MDQLGRAQGQLTEAVRELTEAKEELRRAREELRHCEQSEVEEAEGREEMLLALHSLGGVLRLLSPKPAIETDDEEPVCDEVSPLPGEQPAALSREDQLNMGRRAMRRRWRTDLPVEGRAALTRNTSAQQLPSTTVKDDGTQADPRNTPALPRTLSTSVLRIKQRRSFWEKFVQ